MSKSRYEKLRDERRFVVVPVDLHVFGEMLRDGSAQYKADGLPNDAIFVSADRDTYSQAFHFFYLHESFEPVKEGERGPLYAVTLTRINL